MLVTESELGTEEDEYALAYNIKITNNYFVNTNGYAIDFQGLQERRKKRCDKLGLRFEIPHHIRLNGNIFYNETTQQYPFFNIESQRERAILWEQNSAYGSNLESSKNKGILERKIKFNKNNDYFMLASEFPISIVKTNSIEGLDFDIEEKANQKIFGKPLTWNEAGSKWLKQNPSTYSQTGKLSKMLSARLKKLKKK